MGYRIVMDSCGELPEELKKDPHFVLVPLTLHVGEHTIVDDDTFDQADFLAKVAACPECPKSACPSPELYMEAFGDADDVYVVTLSAKLSGSYNSACVAKMLLKEQTGKEPNVHVVDSKSACCGETQLAYKLRDLCEQGLPFEQVVEEIEKYRDGVNTYFVLDNLETLRKNGRLTGVKALVASTLNIKPVMGAEDGEIIQRAKTIGMKKALNKLVEICLEEVKNPEEKRLMITQVNCPERVEIVKKKLTAATKFKEVLVFDAAGVSSMYANDGGVVVTV